MSLKEAIGQIVDSFIDHLKNRGLFDVVEALVLSLIINRNMKRDRGEYASEEELTREFVHSAFASVTAMDAHQAAKALGLPDPSQFATVEASFSGPRPKADFIGYTGYGWLSRDYDTPRRILSEHMREYNVLYQEMVSGRDRFLKDILLAEKLRGFESSREETLHQPAKENVKLVLVAMIAELLSGPASILHRAGVEGLIEYMYG